MGTIVEKMALAKACEAMENATPFTWGDEGNIGQHSTAPEGPKGLLVLTE